MRIVVTGCRHWHIHDIAESVVARMIRMHGAGITIIQGGADGVDRSFAEACAELGVACETFEADWGRYGRAAGPRRNAAMLAAGADLVVAFHRDLASSRGTLDCTRQAIALGVPTYLCDDETATPRRLHGDDLR